MFIDGSSSTDEGNSERPKSAMSGLSSRKSEADFEKIDAESGTEEGELGRRQTERAPSYGGSWMPWSWGAKAEVSDVDTIMSEDTIKAEDEGKGKSSGIEL
jgi:receptor expression-enhancing protein 1/2/3/4